MIKLDEITKGDYIVLLPFCDRDIKDSVIYSFNNVIMLDGNETKDDAKILTQFINNNLNQLIVFDFCDLYRDILPFIKKNIKVKCIYKNNIAALTNGNVRESLYFPMEFYDRKIIKTIGLLDKSTSVVLKNSKYNVCYVALDVPFKSTKYKKSNSIGLLGDDFNPNHNTYNELSALKLVNYSKLKMVKHMAATEHFINFFGLKENVVENIDDVIKDNFVNLYVNFTSTNVELVLKSMDKNIPCVLGNTDIFDDFSYLKEELVLKSDDDIREIAEKIEKVRLDHDEIIKEYQKFRKAYTKLSQKTIEMFLKK